MILPGDRSLPAFLHSSACAYADDFAVVSRSFRTLMPRIAPACRTSDEMTGMNLNHKKWCWLQRGTQTCDCLHEWVVENCPAFRKMKVSHIAKNLNIGPQGFAHWRTAPRNNFCWVASAIAETAQSLTQKLVAFASYLGLCCLTSAPWLSPTWLRWMLKHMLCKSSPLVSTTRCVRRSLER